MPNTVLRHGVLNKGWASDLFPRRGFVQADTVFPAYPEDVSLCDDADSIVDGTAGFYRHNFCPFFLEDVSNLHN